MRQRQRRNAEEGQARPHTTDHYLFRGHRNYLSHTTASSSFNRLLHFSRRTSNLRPSSTLLYLRPQRKRLHKQPCSSNRGSCTLADDKGQPRANMPTQRPFLSNFLAAFRAHSQQLPQQASKSISTSSGVVAASATVWTSAQQAKTQTPTTSLENAVASPRPIKPRAPGYNSNATPTAAQDRQLQASLSPLQHNVSPATHLPLSSQGLPVYGPPNKPQPSYPTPKETFSHNSRARRRGSDSSSDSGGFREVRGGGETWFIGGRTPGGEEKYYKLSMIKRDTSSDRLSADRLSL